MHLSFNFCSVLQLFDMIVNNLFCFSVCNLTLGFFFYSKVLIVVDYIGPDTHGSGVTFRCGVWDLAAEHTADFIM